MSIVVNIAKPYNNKYNLEWPSISFFGVYDGHGGFSCADFLKDNLHKFIVNN